MGKKLLIDFDIDGIKHLIGEAIALHPQMAQRPNYLLMPTCDGIWQVVGLADSGGGPYFYPYTNCPNCGQVADKYSEVDTEKDLYAIFCGQCDCFCNHLAIYEPLPKVIDALVAAVLQSTGPFFKGQAEGRFDG